MEQPSPTKVCSFYQDTSSSGPFSISPYRFASMCSNELSSSFISSTTENTEQNSFTTEWTNNSFASSQHCSPDCQLPQAQVADRSSATMSWTNTEPANVFLDQKCDITPNKCAKKREKPVHLVARRNARERKRVQAVNSAFVRLRKVVPVENRNKRLSKVKTLHRAIEYIAGLKRLLDESDTLEPELGDASHELLDSAIDHNRAAFDHHHNHSEGPFYMDSVYAQNTLMTSRVEAR